MSTSLPARYYGGDGSAMGTVHRLSPTSWASFVQELLGHPVLLNVTRQQFFALPKKERDAKKRVAFVTPASFLGETAHRTHEQAVSISLIALDIDPTKDGRYPAAPFVKDPNTLHTALAPFAFAAYHTASSTPDAPRIRVMVHCEDLPLASYDKAVRYIAARLGLPSVTKESLVPVQPMYLPTLFRDDDPVEHHPLITALREGEACTLGHVNEGDSSVPTDKKGSGTHGSTIDDLDFLRPTVEHITLEDCEDALTHLDPDCTYPEWLEVAAALRHQFPHQQDAAFSLFDTWSSKGAKYGGREDTDAKWRSLRPSPRGRMPITVRTLLSRAVDSGWAPQTVASKCYGAVLEWLSDDKRTAHELMSVGIGRIAGAPLQSAVERGALLARLRDALGKHKVKVTLSDLKKNLVKLERAQKSAAEIKTAPESELPKWAKGICYVASTNEFFQRHTDRKFSPEGLDSTYGRYLMSGDQESGRPTVRPRDYLLNVLRIPVSDSYRYDPTHPEQAFIQDGKKWYVNTYLPTYPEPDHDDADYAALVVHEHLTHLIREPHYRRVVLDFMAYCVQHPGAKIRWAILLQGVEGSGKTTIAEMLRSALGPTNVTIIQGDLLFSQFNTWANGAQVVAIEEIRVTGHNRHEVMNKLKPCITNETITINGKNKDLRINVPNNANYFMFTNHHGSIAVTDNDRRHFVLQSALQEKAQVRDLLGEAYFNRLYDCIRNRSAGLRAFFEQHTISKDFNPNGHAPVTEYLKLLVEDSATPLSAAIAEALADGDHPLVKPDFFSSKSLKSMLDDSVPRFTDQQLGSALREAGYVQLCRVRLDDGRHYLWAKRGADVGDPHQLALARLAGSDPAAAALL